MPPFNLPLFILGCAGGLLPDVLRVIKNRYRRNIPAHLKRLNFWLGVVLLVVIGGLATWILGATQAIDALLFGYSAPQLFSQLVGGVLVEHQGSADRGAEAQEEFDLRIWWAS